MVRDFDLRATQGEQGHQALCDYLFDRRAYEDLALRKVLDGYRQAGFLGDDATIVCARRAVLGDEPGSGSDRF